MGWREFHYPRAQFRKSSVREKFDERRLAPLEQRAFLLAEGAALGDGVSPWRPSGPSRCARHDRECSQFARGAGAIQEEGRAVHGLPGVADTRSQNSCTDAETSLMHVVCIIS